MPAMSRNGNQEKDGPGYMQNISPDQVQMQVRTFWELFSGKDKSGFERLYAPTATVFAADSRRSEPARLMLVRRERELFSPKSLVKARLGAVTVQVLAADLAAACYSVQFSVTRTLPNGNRVHVEVPHARMTQVFHRSEDGALMIIHEHMSSAEPVAPKILAAEGGDSSGG
jgi:ketosteroid isomerase-like protein